METISKIENHILRFTTDDKNLDLAGAKTFSKEMFEESLKNSCNKVLVIGNLFSETLSSAELIILAEYHAHIMPSIIKMAIVCVEEHLEKIKLWEEVCISRGAVVKAFLDEESAINWLNQIS